MRLRNLPSPDRTDAVLAAMMRSQLCALAEVIPLRTLWHATIPTSIQVNAPIVQEFTPAIGALDVVEIWTEDFGSSGNSYLTKPNDVHGLVELPGLLYAYWSRCECPPLPATR